MPGSPTCTCCILPAHPASCRQQHSAARHMHHARQRVCFSCGCCCCCCTLRYGGRKCRLILAALQGPRHAGPHHACPHHPGPHHPGPLHPLHLCKDQHAAHLRPVVVVGVVVVVVLRLLLVGWGWRQQLVQWIATCCSAVFYRCSSRQSYIIKISTGCQRACYAAIVSFHGYWTQQTDAAACTHAKL